VWQTDARNRAGIDISSVEQGEERTLGAAIGTLDDQPAVVVPGALSRCEHRLAGHHVGAEIEELGLAVQIVHALDATVPVIMSAGGQIRDVVLLHCSPRINHRKLVRPRIENLFTRRIVGEIEALAAQRTTGLGNTHLALHQLVHQGFMGCEVPESPP
jgi:hypothetical protein